MGFCEYCSDLEGSCSDQKNLTMFALEECQATCEGKYNGSCGNRAVPVYAVDGKLYFAAGLLWILLVKDLF